MKKNFFMILTAIACTAILQQSCTNSPTNEPPKEPGKKEMSHGELVERGKYLVTSIGCDDCHTPKIFGPQGMSLDTTKLLSGHPENSPMPPIDKNALKPGNWLLFAGDLTATVGPWGISFSANLTPDTATGIGAWTEDVFAKTLRTGKHLGQDGGRMILPPMPWQAFRNLKDDDMKAIFAYLKALPPIHNKVPAPVSPPDVEKMK
ncbi:MAG: c-type cytochrome [Bacteroidetes bacterium]|nr:c-type cytochrome [Bacteroidota bacterium]